MTDLAPAFNALCDALKTLGPIASQAETVRYEAPPGMTVTRGEVGSNVADILNPTLDTVLDVRRLELSTEATDLAKYLQTVAHSVNARRARLEAAISRWEGGPS
jgi:hypothetical protein